MSACLWTGQDPERKRERESAHSLESAIERENTLARANERARECASNRGLCADRVLRVLDMNFGVNKRQFGREREGKRGGAAGTYLAAISVKHLPFCFCLSECKSPPEQYSMTRHENREVSKCA